MNYEARVAAIGMVLLTSLAATGRTQAPANEPQYNGRWWGSVSSQEQLGFVTGFYDCHTFDVRSSSHFDTKSWSAYRELVSDYYSRDPVRRMEAVTVVLLRFADRPGEKVPTGSEVRYNRHSYFDGDYWMQIFGAGGVEQQRGFVEGYIACTNQFVHSAKDVFPGPPIDYVTKISQWYGFNSHTADMTPNREEVKIADVLRQFRKQD